MDIDGPPVSTPNGDIEASLLQQFNCLGTTDHEELISQMQQLMGVTYGTALFFLDMNNWNLQAAICSYLDFNVEDSQSSSSNQMLYARNVPPMFQNQYALTPAFFAARERKNAMAFEAIMGSETPPPAPAEMMWNGVDLRGGSGSGGVAWRGQEGQEEPQATEAGDSQMDAELSERMAALSAQAQAQADPQMQLQPPPPCPPSYPTSYPPPPPSFPPDRSAC